MTAKPTARPRAPFFSSGPCAKRPGWAPDALRGAALGRSHRAALGKGKLKRAIDLTRSVLRVPAGYRIGIVPASDTGAVEMAMWSLLGARPVEMLAWESFGEGWVTDVAKQLKLADARIIKAEYGALPDLAGVADWIAADREGLTICDATSAAFSQRLDWPKLDVVTFSWQKALGGEAAHGMLILSPRAVERLESYVPAWPMPKIFRMTKGGKLIEGIFQGETINTPSMLCVEDYIDALEWAEGEGGLDGTVARSDRNAAVIHDWVARSGWAANLAQEPATASNTSVCLVISDPDVVAGGPDAVASVAKGTAAALDREGVAFDIGAYRDAPPGLRIWCGATVETADLEALTPWLDWAFAAEKAKRVPHAA